MSNTFATASESLTIVICTYNRAEELRKTLDALADLSWAEVIVVDNASTDGTRRLLRAYPWLRVIRNEQNVGVPGFVAGVDAAMTPYVLLLDDDAIPEPDVADRIVARFEDDALLAAIACHVVTPTGGVVTKDWPERPVLFWGCGAGIRVDVAQKLSPMFYPKLVLHGTELDLCIRLYSSGYHVYYDSSARVVHRFSPTNRSRGRRMRTVTYCSIRFAWDHFSWRTALRATMRAIVSRRIGSFGEFCGWVQGIADVLMDIRDIRGRRHVVPRYVEDAYMVAVWEYQPRKRPRRVVGFVSLTVADEAQQAGGRSDQVRGEEQTRDERTPP